MARPRKRVAAPTVSRSLPALALDPSSADPAVRREWLIHGLAVPRWSDRLRELDPRRFFLATWKALDEEAAEERASNLGYDTRPLLVLAVGAVCLTLMEFLGHSPQWHAILDFFDDPERVGPPTNVFGQIRDSRFAQLFDFVYWTTWRVLGYFVVPALVVKLVLRERIRDHGFSLEGVRGHAWIYLLFYALVFLGVMFVAQTMTHFTEYYPFYQYCSRSWFDLLAWELLYAAQFVSLEFFFRGFWLKSMKRALGSQAIFVMIVPYCMIHFGKPLAEALAAIVAGIVLGTIAMRTRSVWAGCVVHIGVAITMDVTALIVSGRGLPEQGWP